MDSDIQNFAEIESLIRNDPQNADRIASQANILARRIQGKIPEAISLTNKEQVFAFAKNNPQLNLSEQDISTIVTGKSIEEAYCLIRDQEETAVSEQGGETSINFPSPLSLPFLAALYLARPKPQTKEEDGKYQKIAEEKKKQWLKDNPGKDFESKEGIDYLYGSLDKRPDDKNMRSLASDIKQDFNEKYKSRAELYDKKKEKVHKNIEDDHAVNNIDFRIDEHTSARFALWKKQNPSATTEQAEAMQKKLQMQIERYEYRKFVTEHNTKAEAYALRDQKNETAKKIKKSLESVKNEEKRREAQQKRMTEKRLRAQEQRKRIEEKKKTVGTLPPLPHQPEMAPLPHMKPLEPIPEITINQSPRPTMGSRSFSQPRISYRPSSSTFQTPPTRKPRGGRFTRATNWINGLRKPKIPIKPPVLPPVANLSKLLLGPGGSVLIVLGFLLIMVIILSILAGFTSIPGGPDSTLGGITPPPSGGTLTCNFTRSGTSSPIKSTILQGWFLDIGNSIGVPPAILASVAMHESPDFVTNADDSNDAIKTNHYCNTGQTVCVAPDNKTSYVRSCTSSERASGWREGHAQGLMQIMDLYHPSDDLCSITTSITIAAQQLKSLGITLSPTESDVDSAIQSYFGSSSCTYGAGYSYCDEVWKDYQACTGAAPPPAPPSLCAGTPISLGVTKEFLPLPGSPSCAGTDDKTCGRPGYCTTPKKIVVHTTWGGSSAQNVYEYFASGAGGRGVASHFIIGKDGQMLQLVDSFSNIIEVAYAVHNYIDHISIELVNDTDYSSKSAVPPAQYSSLISLIRTLMSQYHVPLGTLEYDWLSSTDSYNPAAIPGIYGHYQLNPATRSDPGEGLVKDLRNDLR